MCIITGGTSIIFSNDDLYGIEIVMRIKVNRIERNKLTRKILGDFLCKSADFTLKPTMEGFIPLPRFD